LKKCGTYAAGMGGILDLILVFWQIFNLNRTESSTKHGAKLMYKVGNKNRRPPFITILKAKDFGYIENKKVKVTITLSHDDSWIATAIPIAACIFQLLDGTINQYGTFKMGEIVNISRFKDDLVKLVLHLSTKFNYN